MIRVGILTLFSMAVFGLAACGDDGGSSNPPPEDSGFDVVDAGDDTGEDTVDTGTDVEPDVPPAGNLCTSCQMDEDCGGPADRCLQLPGEPGPTCARACDPEMEGDCPAGYFCAEVNEGEEYQCAPDSLFCVDRCLTVECPGNDVCDNATGECGPALELCDTPCVSDGQCGGPEDICIGLPTTNESICSTACDIEDAESCPEEYTCVELDNGATHCIPDALTCIERCEGVVCEPGMGCDPWTGDCAPLLGICDTECDNSALCGGPDDICISPGNEGDEAFCATACETSFDCPLNYFCGALEERELGVCVPVSLTCIDDRCDAVDCGNGFNCDPRTGECVEAVLDLCDSCGDLDSPSCGGANDLCLGLADPGGVICSLDCTDDQECPDGYDCAQLGNTTFRACVPTGGDCLRCAGVECDSGTFCNPLTGECTAPPENCSVSGCGAGEICNLETERCEVVGETCTWETRAEDCLSIVRRCTATRPGSSGTCARVCNTTDDCSTASPNCIRVAGVNEDLCLPDGLGGPATCGVIAPDDAEIGRRCGAGISSSCPAGAPTCLTDVDDDVPGFCSVTCSSDADCNGEGVCQDVRGTGQSFCLPANCLCLAGATIGDGETDLVLEALVQHELSRCSFVIDPLGFGQLDPATTTAPLTMSSVSGYVVQPLSAVGAARGLEGDLRDLHSASSPTRDALVATAARRALAIEARDPTFALPAGNAFVEGLRVLVEAAGGTFNTGDIVGDPDSLPVELQDALGQVLAAAAEIVLARQGAADAVGLSPADLAELFDSAPWLFLPAPNGATQLDPTDVRLTDLDLGPLAQAAADLAAVIDANDTTLSASPAYDGLDIRAPTPVGWVIVGASGVTTHDPAVDTDLADGVALLVDVSGDDEYLFSAGGTVSSDNVVSIVLDLEGDDVYGYEEVADPADQAAWLPSDAGGRFVPTGPLIAGNGPVSLSDTARQGAGRLGVGMLIDRAGADEYTSLRMSQGAGILGIGVLVDHAGADTYEIEAFGQGAGMLGLGVLLDLSGAGGMDTYRAWHAGQGFGGPLGVGLLAEMDGPSSYLAEPATGLSDVLYFARPDRGQSNLNLCQGAAAGRLPDADGNFATGGGIGVLFDANGNDAYVGGVYVQGAGRHLGAGFAVDLAGDDTWDGRYGSQGGGEIAAVGVLFEGGGDDDYHKGTGRVLSSTLGAGVNLGAGICVDVDGADEYEYPNLSGGVGVLNGLGGFFDLAGSDVHTALGATTRGSALLGPEGNEIDNPRRTIPTLGLFIDGGGLDTYEGPNGNGAASNTTWVGRNDPDMTIPELGAGIDGDGVTGL